MKKQCLPLIFWLFLLSLSFYSCEKETEEPQTFGQLIGQIRSEEGLAIPNARIQVNAVNFSDVMLAASSGTYNFERVPSGKLEISVSAEGYIGITESYEVKPHIVNEKDITLKLGEALLDLSIDRIHASVVAGKTELEIKSNTGWNISSNANWVNTNTDSGQGNQTIIVNWNAHSGENAREAIIEVKAGNLVKTIKVFQSKALNILEVNAIFGNLVKEKAPGFELVFSGPVTLTGITNLTFLCQPLSIPFEYNTTKDRITFTYTCGRIGGTYPFLIEYTDALNNQYAVNIDVEYFDESLRFDGYIQSRHTLSGEDKQWVLTRDPDRLYLLDLQKLEILKTFHLGSINPWNLSLNPYNNQLYVATRNAELLVYNSNNGNLFQRIELPGVPFQEFNKFFVNDMVFNQKGIAVMEVYQTGSSGISWFIMDSADGHQIQEHPDMGWDNGQLTNILFPTTSTDQKYIYFYGQGIEDRGVFKMDEKAEKWSNLMETWDLSLVSNMIKSRKEEKFILDHGDIQVLDNGQRFDLGYRGYNHTGSDFCYGCSQSKTILLVGNEKVLDFLDYGSGELYKHFQLGGNGNWIHLLQTLDGKHMVVTTDNYNHDPETGYASAQMLRIAMERFD